MGVNLASFPNSRINPTPATSIAIQSDVVAPPNTIVGPVPALVPANPNRTYLEIYNRSLTDSFKYIQTSGPAPTAAAILASGFEIIAGAAYEIESPQPVYAVSSTAAPVPIDLDEGNG
jgi:hypothetical protein